MQRLPMLETDFSSFLLPQGALAKTSRSLAPYLAELGQVVENRDENHLAASLLLSDDKAALGQSSALAARLGSPNLVIVVGVGGSNLGALAVSQALLGPYHNSLEPNRQLIFADTTDAPSISAILSLARQCQDSGGSVVINVISKSGATLETMALFTILRDALPDLPSSHIVVTTDASSALERQASASGWPCLTLPKMVGGRYSVFSNAGLFPLALMGIETGELLSGAAAMRKQCLASGRDAAKNPALHIAAGLEYHRLQGRTIHDQFLFSNSLCGAGQWYRQLMAESLGKERKAAAGGKNQPAGGKKIHVGITPTVSIGSTDLHSMVQLDLAGPADKTHRFVSVASFADDPRVPDDERLNSLVPHAGGKTVSQLMDSILHGAKTAFSARHIPFIDVRLPALSAHAMGQLMQMEMVEIMLLGRLMKVNAFDQPAVEEYKKETRKKLMRF